mgnify:CR=1 FL=1
MKAHRRVRGLLESAVQGLEGRGAPTKSGPVTTTEGKLMGLGERACGQFGLLRAMCPVCMRRRVRTDGIGFH